MAKFVDLMYQSTGTTIDSETAMSDYTPPIDCRLVGVKIEPGGIAATSLVEYGYVRLRSVSFGGVDVVAHFHGIGLETVPRDNKPTCMTECDVKVEKGTPIKGSYYYNVTPVTPELFVYGIFEA